MKPKTLKSMLAPLDTIEVGERILPIDQAQVTNLVESFRITGMLNPITVTAAAASEGNKGEQRWNLVAGAHRLAACRALGFTEIAITVHELGTQEQIIAECDENLCGTNLGHADRALLMSRRKVAFEELHPETRHGASGVGRKKSRQIGDSNRFTLDAATKTGRAERTVQRDVLRGGAIDAEVLAKIRNTDLDRGAVLDELARTPRPEQAAKVLKLLQDEGARTATPITLPDVAAVGTAIEAGTIQALPSDLAVWLLWKLGIVDTKVCIGMLQERGFHNLAAEMLAAIAEHEFGLDGAQSAERASCEAAEIAVRVAHADDGTEESRVLAADSSATALDTAAPLDELSTVSKVDDATDEAKCDGNPNCPTEDNSAIPPVVGLLSASRSRQASWFGVDNLPQTGDRCSECKGSNWWFDDTGRGIWKCGGCFEHNRRSFRRPMICNTES